MFREQSKNCACEMLKEICQVVRRQGLICSVLVNGSYGRGDFTEFSDIDLVLIGYFSKSSSEIKLILERKFCKKFSVICFTEKQFEKSFKMQSLILWFIFKEAQVLYDDGLFEYWKQKTFILKKNYHQEIKHELSKLNPIELSIEYSIEYSQQLSKIYGIFKNIAIFKIAESGKPTSNKKIAIESYLSSQAFSVDEVSSILNLDNYFNYVNGMSKNRPPNNENHLIKKIFLLALKLKEINYVN